MKKKLPPIDDKYFNVPEAAEFTGQSEYKMRQLADQGEALGLSYKEGGERKRRYLSWTLLKIAKKFAWWVILIGAIILLYKCTS